MHTFQRPGVKESLRLPLVHSFHVIVGRTQRNRNGAGVRCLWVTGCSLMTDLRFLSSLSKFHVVMVIIVKPQFISTQV